MGVGAICLPRPGIDRVALYYLGCGESWLEAYRSIYSKCLEQIHCCIMLFFLFIFAATGEETVESVAKRQEALASQLGSLSTEIHKLKYPPPRDELQDPTLDPLTAQLVQLQQQLFNLSTSVRSLVSEVPAARRAAGIDYSPAEQYIARLGHIGDRLKAVERTLVSFDDKDLALKIDHSFQAHNAASQSLTKSVGLTQVSSILSQASGLNQVTANDTRFVWLYVLGAGVSVLLGLMWLNLRKSSTSSYI